MKKSSRLFAAVSVCLVGLCWASIASAQDPGAPDSVYINMAEIVRYANDSMTVAIIVSTDEPLSAVSIPIYYRDPGDYWDLDATHAFWGGTRWTTTMGFSGLDDRSGENGDTLKLYIYFQALATPLPAGRDTIATLHFFPRAGAGDPTGMWEIGFTRVDPDNVVQFVTDDFPPVNISPMRGYLQTVSPNSFAAWPPVLQISTEVLDITASTGIPDKYGLSQNYPNPFNASTIIEFAVREPGHVTLEIFNILGQKVAVPVNEFLSAGVKRTTWDGKNFSGDEVASGMYFYRLTAGDFVEMKKMVLMK